MDHQWNLVVFWEMCGVMFVVFVGCFADCSGDPRGVVVQVPGGLLHRFQGVSKYRFFSPGIQVELFFLDFGVLGNATWISRSSWRLKVTREGFKA